MDVPVAVVTGAGAGLGRELVLGLARRGYRVFGTARSVEEVDDVREASQGRAALSRTDITRADEVASFATTVSAETGGVDLLISNAGILTPGPLEVLALDAIRQEFEVNVFGALAVINAFLPSLRAAKGRLVQIGTMSVDMPMPFNGPSVASKAAMDAFATVYRAELDHLDIDVVVLVPGSMRTGGPAKTAAALQRVSDEMTDEQRNLYGRQFDTFAALLNGAQSQGTPAPEAAELIIEAALRRPAPRRLPIGADAVEMFAYIRATTAEEQDARRVALITPSR